MIHRVRLSAALVCLAGALSAKPSAAASLAAKIDRLLAAPALRRTAVGVVVTRLDTGAVVYSRRAARRFILASNTKILTTAAAVHLLGADFQFNTRILRTGAIGPDGVLRGDVVVAGDGDPNISGRCFDGDVTSVMRQIVQIIKDQGVRRIAGDVVGDDRIFDREYMRPHTQAYTYPVSGLPFNDNCIDALVSPTQPGAAASITLTPATAYVALDNRCLTSADRRRDRTWFRFSADAATLQARGHIYVKAAPRRYHIPLADPGLYFATVLKETLERAGVRVDGRVRWPRDGESFEGLEELANVKSGLEITLPEINKRSNNFYADTLFKRVGAKTAGRGSYASGAAAAAQFLAAIGAPDDRVTLRDGCGLSRENQASPRVLAYVLRYMARSPARDLFVNSLAVAGEDGTLRRRLTRPAYRGRVRAKTGYIRRVSALSGYADARSGSTYVFSMLFNGFRSSNAEMKRIQDAVCRAIIDGG